MNICILKLLPQKHAVGSLHHTYRSTPSVEIHRRARTLREVYDTLLEIHRRAMALREVYDTLLEIHRRAMALREVYDTLLKSV